MPYSYYSRLSAACRKNYCASNKYSSINLKNSTELIPYVEKVKQALSVTEKALVQRATQTFTSKITNQLEVPSVKVKVLACRPFNYYGELYGLYEPIRKDKLHAEISVWMRTAKRKQIVAFKTYMRTLLHELCHHLDYELFGLEDSFHTEGFFKRESSLYKQLVL